LNTVETCDSVWVFDTNNGGVDLIDNFGGNNITVVFWELECDSVYTNNQQLIYQCDSVWVTAVK
jgi:hypothetical protein